MPCVFPLTVDEVAVLSAFPLSPLALAALAPSLAANPPEGPALFGHVKGKYVGEEEMRWREERAGRKKWLRENKWESGGEKERDRGESGGGKERDKEGRVEERRVEIQRGEWRREGQRWRGESEGEKQRDGEGRVKERRREGKQDRVEENGKHGVLVGMGAKHVLHNSVLCRGM